MNLQNDEKPFVKREIGCDPDESVGHNHSVPLAHRHAWYVDADERIQQIYILEKLICQARKPQNSSPHGDIFGIYWKFDGR